MPPSDAFVPSQPLQADAPERLISLDFIRGIAVMGILGANIIGFGQPFVGYYWPGGFATGPQPSDPWLWASQLLLIDGKMRGLFTLLFGAGLALFADRAAARGASGWLQVRRLAWLFVFGLAHYYLIWRGDILTLYALCGLVALVAVGWTVVQQFALGISLALFGALSGAATIGAMWSMTSPASSGDVAGAVASERADGVREMSVASQGTWMDYVSHVATEHRWQWLESIPFSFLETVPLMLIGMACYRAGLLDGRRDPRQQARWGWAGIIAGTLMTALVAGWAVSRDLTYGVTLFAIEGAGAVTRIPVVLGLAALLSTWAPHAHARLATRITAAGRMAFSNYLGTSLVMLVIFQPPGWRLFGLLDRIELYCVMLAIWVAILAWSKPWLERFRFGPLEWLWRCLTYGRRIALRR